MSKHTPEPWEANQVSGTSEYFITEYDEYIDADKFPEIARVYSEANAARIVACVNACKDIPTEHLENAAENTRKIIANAKAIEQQRDELLAILEDILQQPDRIAKAATAHSIAQRHLVTEPVRVDSEWYGRILAAIAKAKGGSHE